MPRYLSPTAVHSLPPYYAEHHPYSRVERHSPAPTLVAHSSPLRSYSPHHGGPSHHGGLLPSAPPPSFHTGRNTSFAHPSGKEMYPYVKGKKVSPEQLAELLALFAQDDNPSKEQRTYHANRLKMSFKALSIWFQNERANVKKGRVRVCTPISGSSSSRPSLLHIRTTTTPIRDQVQSATTDGSPVSPYNNSHVLIRGTPSSSYPSFGGSGVGRSHQQRPHGFVGANRGEDVTISRNDKPSTSSGNKNSISMILNDTTSHVTDYQNRDDGRRPAVVPATEDEAEYHSDGESRYSASSSEYAHDSDETTQVITPVMPISKELAPIINVSPPGCSLSPSRARGGRLDDEGLMVAEILAGMKRSASP